MMDYKMEGIVGNTPLVKLKNIVPKDCADIYVKLEYFNPTGSYKDRLALSIIEEAEKRGDLRPGMTVVECTAGSTGTSLAWACAVKGYEFKVVTAEVFAKEKLISMKLFGATMEFVESKEGKITPDLIPRMMDRVREISRDENVYWTRQFENQDGIMGYRKMGKEIVDKINGPVHVFCAAVGTAGMLTGVSLELKQKHPDCRVVVLEPESSPLLSQGIKGSHRIDGIGVGFVPPLLKNENYDQVKTVHEEAARSTAQQLASMEGVFAGTSTGLNVCAALEIGKELGKGHVVVTAACDSGMKYLSGGLFG